jgi:hypothetical protein
VLAGVVVGAAELVAGVAGAGLVEAGLALVDVEDPQAATGVVLKTTARTSPPEARRPTS